MTLKELKTLIKVLRANGVVKFKDQDLELDLLPLPEIPESYRERADVKLQAVKEFINEPVKNDYPTPEQFLFMASDGTLPKIEDIDA